MKQTDSKERNLLKFWWLPLCHVPQRKVSRAHLPHPHPVHTQNSNIAKFMIFVVDIVALFRHIPTQSGQHTNLMSSLKEKNEKQQKQNKKKERLFLLWHVKRHQSFCCKHKCCFTIAFQDDYLRKLYQSQIIYY